VRSATLVLLVSTNVAHAEEPIAVREGLTRETNEQFLQLDSALSSLDTTLRSNTEGFEADVNRETFDFSIGADTRARIESSAWTNPLVAGHGWGASLRMVHDFKVIQIGVEASLQRVDSGAVEAPVGKHGTGVHASYVYLGAVVTKTFRLSKKRKAWFSLSVGKRQWLGDEQPPGEVNDVAGFLSFGFTF
jgi:hypothetical protein